MGRSWAMNRQVRRSLLCEKVSRSGSLEQRTVNLEKFAGIVSLESPLQLQNGFGETSAGEKKE